VSRVLAILIAIFWGAAASAQFGPPAESASAPRGIGSMLLGSGDEGEAMGDALNPLRVLDDAAGAMSGRSGEGSGAGLSAALNVMLVLTVISLVPSILLLCTCFLRILVVLGLLKQAMGTQSLPPPQVITGLALFMTMVVMAPTMERIWTEAVEPYRAGEIRDYDVLWERAKQPMRDFMFDQIEASGNWSSVYMMLNYRGIDTSEPENLTRADVDMVSLVPAFVLSELKTAFVMGFRVYLPFLVIDMVIASVLISMSMMMLPPVLISLPFKLLLFILVDGWQLVVGGLMTSFVTPATGGSGGSGGVLEPESTGAMLDGVIGVYALASETVANVAANVLGCAAGVLC
jgi:flagellar biosynthetic protein FliP